MKVLLMVGDATMAPKKIYERMGECVPKHGAHFACFHGGTHCLFHQAEHLPKFRQLLEQLLHGSLENNSSPGQLSSGAVQRPSQTSAASAHLPAQTNALQNAVKHSGVRRALPVQGAYNRSMSPRLLQACV